MKSSYFRLNQPSKNSRGSHKGILLFMVLLLIGAGGYFAYRHYNQPAVDKNATDPTIKSAKDSVKDENSKTSAVASSNETSEQVPVNTALSVSNISSSQANGLVSSSATIDGTTASGKCVFSYSAPDSKTVVEEAASSGQKCSVNTPEVSFDKIGEWTLTVTFYQNNTKASASTKVIIN